MKESLLSLIYRGYSCIDRRSQLLILTLHRVGGGANIQLEHVRQHFSYLSKNYQTILPSQLMTTKGCSHVAMVTIDDCHDDTYQWIYPLAKEFGIPITICVPTDFFFRQKWLWFDKLKFCFEQAKVHLEGNELFIGSEHHNKIIRANLKQQPVQTRDAMIESLIKELGVNLPENIVDGFNPVSEQAMLEMLKSGLVEICAHTVSHPILTQLSDEELIKELSESKRELEEFTGKEVISFCYPNGELEDFDERTRDSLKKVGHKIVFTSIEGLNHPKNMDLYELKRIHAHRRQSVFLKLAVGISGR